MLAALGHMTSLRIDLIFQMRCSTSEPSTWNLLAKNVRHGIDGVGMQIAVDGAGLPAEADAIRRRLPFLVEKRA
jgi:hypothetical protein